MMAHSSSRGALPVTAMVSRRWTELQPADEPESPLSIGAVQSGAVFLSYAREDLSVAESIRDALDRGGVDVVFDNDDATGVGGKWEKKLRSVVSECSLFMPVVSKRSIAAERRFFRAEWVAAILEARKAIPSGRFILPVAIDDTSPTERAIPEEFGKLDWERWTSGKPNSELVEKVVQLQRSYRSASFA